MHMHQVQISTKTDFGVVFTGKADNQKLKRSESIQKLARFTSSSASCKMQREKMGKKGG